LRCNCRMSAAVCWQGDTGASAERTRAAASTEAPLSGWIQPFLPFDSAFTAILQQGAEPLRSVLFLLRGLQRRFHNTGDRASNGRENHSRWYKLAFVKRLDEMASMPPLSLTSPDSKVMGSLSNPLPYHRCCRSAEQRTPDTGCWPSCAPPPAEPLWTGLRPARVARHSTLRPSHAWNGSIGGCLPCPPTTTNTSRRARPLPPFTLRPVPQASPRRQGRLPDAARLDAGDHGGPSVATVPLAPSADGLPAGSSHRRRGR